MKYILTLLLSILAATVLMLARVTILCADSHAPAAEAATPTMPARQVTPVCTLPIDDTCTDRVVVDTPAAESPALGCASDDPVDVQVVDAGTQAPVPGAVVRWRHADGPATSFDESDSGPFDHETLADNDGLARIATSKRGAAVRAYAGERYGSALVACDAGPVTVWRIEVAPDRTLQALTVDADGRPVPGVEVCIRLLDRNGEPLPGSLASAVSRAPSGLAEFRHVQDWRRRMGASSSGLFECRVTVRVPGHVDEGVAFDFDAPSPDPVVLRVPATGRLRARLLHSGRPLVTGVAFAVWRSSDDDDPEAARRLPVDRDGWAWFASVGLGGQLAVMAQYGSSRVTRIVDAPPFAGREVTVELDTDDIFSLAGVLFCPDGEPLTNSSVVADFDAEIVSGRQRIDTDARGRFQLLLTQGDADRAQLRRLVLSRQSDDGVARVVVAPRGLQRGVNDLGALRLAPGPLVVAGRFTFVETPPRRVQFVVEECVEEPPDGTQGWRAVEDLTTVLGGDGAFEVRGHVRRGIHRLSFPGSDHLPIDPCAFRLGDDHVVVPVEFGHDLSVRVQGPDGLPADRIVGLLRPLGESSALDGPGPGSSHYAADVLPGDAGQFLLRWTAVRAGEYALEVRARGLLPPLARVDGVSVPVPRGGDPRLALVDASEAIHVVRLAVSYADQAAGGEDAGATCFLLPQVDPMLWHGQQVRAGQTMLAVPWAAAGLLIAKEGYRPQEARCDGNVLAVHLEPWPQIELVFGDLPMLPAGCSLSVALLESGATRQDHGRYLRGSHGGALQSLLQCESRWVTVENGRAVLGLGEGTFTPAVLLHRAGSGRAVALDDVVPGRIASVPHTEQASVRVTVGDMREAIARLEGDDR